jgi:hypothetical protein
MPIAFVVSLTSCSQSNYDFFIFNLVTSGWSTTVFVNDNPVFRGGDKYSVGKDISMWLKNGENKIRYEIEKEYNDFSSENCQIVFAKTNPSNPANSETLNEFFIQSPKEKKLKAEFIIVNPNKVIWLWEKAEKITFSEKDKKEIYDIILNIFKALNARDASLVKCNFDKVWDTKDLPEVLEKSSTQMEKISNDNFKSLFSEQKLTITVLPMNELCFINGKNTVLVFPKENYPELDRNKYIVFAGSEVKIQNEYHYKFQIDQLVFIKINGYWRLLNT